MESLKVLIVLPALQRLINRELLRLRQSVAKRLRREHEGAATPYFPGADLYYYGGEDLENVAQEVEGRRRKTFDGRAPSRSTTRDRNRRRRATATKIR